MTESPAIFEGIKKTINSLKNLDLQHLLVEHTIKHWKNFV